MEEGRFNVVVSINILILEDFINAKLEQGKVTGANISVRIDDEFMSREIEWFEYEQRNIPVLAKSEVSKTIFAEDLWKK